MLVFYHHPCSDGFCSAWIWRKKYPDAEFIGINYNGVSPDHIVNVCINRDVVILDFSFKRELMLRVRHVAKSLLCLDHHKTARDELDGIPGCVFDMSRAGCQMTWDYLFPGEPRPWIVEYVADRDLWKWELPGSREISNGLRIIPFEFEEWDGIVLKGEILQTGTAITKYLELKIASAVEKAVPFVYGLVTNCTDGDIISDVAGKLAEKSDTGVGATFFVDGTGRFVYSLRSRGDVDVSEIAKKHGGGGHKNAAGFTSDVRL